jgi:ABC-type phosphate transport system auxiliary subunit
MITLTTEYIGLFLAILTGLAAVGLLVRAIARVAKLERQLMNLDWSSLSELVQDVETLKRQAMKQRNITNGLKRTQQKEDLEAKLQEVQLQRQANVMPMGNVER